MLGMFLVFLGFTFSAVAQYEESSKTPPQEGHKTLCNPREKTKMPETFY